MTNLLIEVYGKEKVHNGIKAFMSEVLGTTKGSEPIDTRLRKEKPSIIANEVEPKKTQDGEEKPSIIANEVEPKKRGRKRKTQVGEEKLDITTNEEKLDITTNEEKPEYTITNFITACTNASMKASAIDAYCMHKVGCTLAGLLPDNLDKIPMLMEGLDEYITQSK